MVRKDHARRGGTKIQADRFSLREPRSARLSDWKYERELAQLGYLIDSAISQERLCQHNILSYGNLNIRPLSFQEKNRFPNPLKQHRVIGHLDRLTHPPIVSFHDDFFAEDLRRLYFP